MELELHKTSDPPWHAAGLGHRDNHHGLLGLGHARHDGHHRRRGLHDSGAGQRPAPKPHFLAVRGTQRDPAPSYGPGALAGRAVIVEYIFTYPGMGYLLYDGIVNGDYTLIQGVVYFLIVGVALTVLIIDLIYPLIDPRITYQKK